MLIDFRVENHRSIRDEQVLSMEAGRVGANGDPVARTIEGYPDKLLPVVALYGANASGKSNVLSAIGFMREAVIYSQRSWSPDEGIPRDPFAWGQKRDEPSLYEIEIMLEGVRYRYGFRVNSEVFLEEWLLAWPNGKLQTWLTREGENFKYGEHLGGPNKVIEDVTRKNALFLSAAAQLKHPQLSPIFSWFGSIETLKLPMSRRGIYQRRRSDTMLMLMMLEEDREARQQTLFATDEPTNSMAKRVKSLLKNADIGILDMRVNRKEPLPPGTGFRNSGLEFKHQSESADAWLPLEEESRGTQTLFQLSLPIIRTIEDGRLLVVDELEASMHPNLAEHIVQQFNDPEINARNAQLIFSTHDTNLLGTLVGDPVLRRNQVWLTEKDTNGGTVLYPLTDFKPRKEENIERGYVQGRYGAIPYLGKFRVPEG
jgi:uncharacterized protein